MVRDLTFLKLMSNEVVAKAVTNEAIAGTNT